MIAKSLQGIEEEKLLWVFKEKRETFGWNIHDRKGLDPILCTRKIKTKEESLSKWSFQRKHIPNMMEVVKGVLYCIFLVELTFGC